MEKLGTWRKNHTEQNGPGSVENASKKMRDAAVFILGEDTAQVHIYDWAEVSVRRARLHPHLLPFRAALLLNAATAA